jgi:hypothetical protein
MKAKIISKNQKYLKIEIEIPLSKSMLTSEEAIQKATNLVGELATGHALTLFDTDGSPIKIKDENYTSKGQVPKIYQTPYGEIEINRHVYQTNQGGETFCPLEHDARIIVGTTPKFAKMVSSKYSRGGSQSVQTDLSENHGRTISRSFIQDISESVSAIIKEKEDKWQYHVPVSPELVTTIGISLDGTCMLMVKDGYRSAMVGTITLYDQQGERLFTHYTAAAPEYGKSTFLQEFEKEISLIKIKYLNAIYVGIADGAKDNWLFLEQHTQFQILDFYHATEYLSDVSDNGFKQKEKGTEWFKKSRHNLKHEKGSAKSLLKELKEFRALKIAEPKMKKIEAAITYFENHLHQMNYPEYSKKYFPIGSGIVEAACKVIIKQRLCNSGMKWKQTGAQTVLCLRCFNYTDDKWNQFWNKINKYGID